MNSFLSLMYHNIVSPGQRFMRLSPSVTSYFVDQPAFARHLDCVAEQGRCLRMKDVRRMMCEPPRGEVPQSLPGVQVTFDDGWKGSIELGGPLLESHGFEGLLFVTTGLIGKQDFVTRHDLQTLSSNVFQVGSHAHTHQLLNRLTNVEVREELTSSKLILEDLLGTEIDSLSLPGGAGNSRVLQIAREAGYRLIFTSEVHLNSRQTSPSHIGRVPIKQTTTVAEVRKFATHRLGSMRLRRGCLQVAKQILGSQRYERLRCRFLGADGDQRDMVELCTN